MKTVIKEHCKFPSPYGVSFIPIEYTASTFNDAVIIVSVSLRSIIHSYSRNVFNLLRGEDIESFRLLTEYHSFLYDNYMKTVIKEHCKFPSPYGVSFIPIKLII